jgi:cobalt-zinc-cadmium efflux system membrane fusion protein
VPALDASRISAGDAATVTTSSGQPIAATVRVVTPTVNEQTRAATVLLSLVEGHAALMPGEIAKALITPKNGTHAGVVLPEDAVQVIDGRNVVFVRSATGFTVKPVTVGTRSGGQVMLLAGLDAGEKIATRNAFLLKAEFAKDAGDEEE